jgi:uncharacterized membrane protein
MSNVAYRRSPNSAHKKLYQSLSKWTTLLAPPALALTLWLITIFKKICDIQLSWMVICTNCWVENRSDVKSVVRNQAFREISFILEVVCFWFVFCQFQIQLRLLSAMLLFHALLLESWVTGPLPGALSCRLLHLLHLNSTQSCLKFEVTPSRDIHHYDRFVFLRQLNFLERNLSIIASLFCHSHSNLDRNWLELSRRHFVVVQN